jgi:hypothetical protein
MMCPLFVPMYMQLLAIAIPPSTLPLRGYDQSTLPVWGSNARSVLPSMQKT